MPRDDEWDDDDAETVPCPFCRREIYEEAERCPYCEKYVSDADRSSAPKPVWIMVGTVLCIIVIYFWIVG